MLAALLVSMTLAQPVPPSGAGCGPGKPCTATTFTSTAGAIMTKRKASGNSFMCLNNSNGTNGAAWSFYTDPTYTNGVLFGTTPAPTATANACSMPPTSSVFVADNSVSSIRFDYHINHATTEYYQNAIAAGSLPTCSSSYQPAINPISGSVTMAYCNQVDWSAFATTGSAYSGSTVAAPHPAIGSGVDTGGNFAGPRMMQTVHVDPETTAFVADNWGTAPALTGTNCGAPSTVGTGVLNTYGLPALYFNTGGAANDFCSFEKTAGYVIPVMFPRITHTIQLPSITNELVWVGWRPDTNTLFGADAPAGSWCAFRYSTNAADTTWQACSNDGGGATCDNTAVTVSTSNIYTLSIEKVETGCHFRIWGRTNNRQYSAIKTTQVPAATDKLYPTVGVQALSAAVRQLAFVRTVQERQ